MHPNAGDHGRGPAGVASLPCARGDRCRQGLGRGSGRAGVSGARSEFTARLPAPPALRKDGQSPSSWPLAPCPFPGDGRNLPFPLKSWGQERSHGMHILLSAGQAHREKVSSRRVPVAERTDVPREEAPPWAGSPRMREEGAYGVDRQTRAVPWGAHRGHGTTSPLGPGLQAVLPASEGRDLYWKPGRPQSPASPLPARKELAQGARPGVELSGGVRLVEGPQV